MTSHEKFTKSTLKKRKNLEKAYGLCYNISCYAGMFARTIKDSPLRRSARMSGF